MWKAGAKIEYGRSDGSWGEYISYEQRVRTGHLGLSIMHRALEGGRHAIQEVMKHEKWRIVDADN